MSFIQRRAVLPVILVASIVAVLGAFLVSSQFVFGQEAAPGCLPTVGVTIATFDSEGNLLSGRVSNGDDVSYSVRLAIPESPAGEVGCPFSGGQLSVTLPSGDTVDLAGVAGAADIPTVSLGAVYVSPAVPYTVNQVDAENMVLIAQAIYHGGESHSVDEGEDPAEGSVSNQIRMTPPGIEIQITPSTQLVYLGGVADFTVTVANTGGFTLSNVEVADSLNTNCTASFGSIVVGASENYSCSTIPEVDSTNEATVTAQIIGGVPAAQSQVTDSASATIDVETVLIAIDLSPDLQPVRSGSAATIMVEVTNPGPADLTDVKVTIIPMAVDCDRVIIAMAAEETVSYECQQTLPLGLTRVTGTVIGKVEGIDTLSNSDEVRVQVFALGLYIEKEPVEPTIHKGDSATFTITIGNPGGSALSNVQVTDVLSPDCSRELDGVASDETITYECSSEELQEGFENTIDVEGTAPDGGLVTASASAIVDLINPTTVIEFSQTDSMVLRVIVNVLTITDTNTGDVALTDPYVEVEPIGRRLDLDSPEFIGGDDLDDGIMDPGEVWEWRLVTVAIVGDGLILPTGSTSVSYEATGHGIDSLGADVTFPAVLTERDTLELPIGN
jgi:uncharacterized repeat protein (TIGR01451 family)